MADAKKDPNGLIRQDMDKLYRAFPVMQISTKHTEREIMFAAGEQRVINWIEQNLIAGHRTRR